MIISETQYNLNILCSNVSPNSVSQQNHDQVQPLIQCSVLINSNVYLGFTVFATSTCGRVVKAID